MRRSSFPVSALVAAAPDHSPDLHAVVRREVELLSRLDVERRVPGDRGCGPSRRGYSSGAWPSVMICCRSAASRALRAPALREAEEELLVAGEPADRRRAACRRATCGRRRTPPRARRRRRCSRSSVCLPLRCRSGKRLVLRRTARRAAAPDALKCARSSGVHQLRQLARRRRTARPGRRSCG